MSSPLVYSYYDPVPNMDVGREASLIVHWMKSWRAQEFLPVMLTHQHADAHPRAKEFMQLISRFPSINPPGYDRACWMRWLALAQVGGGLMTDYDVIARVFVPEFLTTLPDDINVLDRGGVPCAVYTTKEGANKIVDNMIDLPHVHDGKHYSDMYHFQKMGYPKAPNLTSPFGAPGWQLAPAIHFSHHDCSTHRPGVSRALVISSVMDVLNI